MAIRAGAMRHRIAIEEPSYTGGEPVPDWSLVAEVWAAMERTPGTEVWAAAQRNAQVPVVFRCRYLGGITPAMRVVYDGRVHDISSVVDPSGRRAEMLIVTNERVGEAP